MGGSEGQRIATVSPVRSSRDVSKMKRDLSGTVWRAEGDVECMCVLATLDLHAFECMSATCISK